MSESSLLAALTLLHTREKSESRNTKLQRKLEKLNSETEYTLQESKSTLEALEEAREINQKVLDPKGMFYCYRVLYFLVGGPVKSCGQ